MEKLWRKNSSGKFFGGVFPPDWGFGQPFPPEKNKKNSGNFRMETEMEFPAETLFGAKFFMRSTETSKGDEN